MLNMYLNMYLNMNSNCKKCMALSWQPMNLGTCLVGVVKSLPFGWISAILKNRVIWTGFVQRILPNSHQRGRDHRTWLPSRGFGQLESCQ